MSLDPVNRKMCFLAGILAFIGVALGVIALGTNYWTMEQMVTPGMAMPTNNGTIVMNENVAWTWNGLFWMCSTHQNMGCMGRFWATTFILCLLGVMFMLVGGIFSVMEMFMTSDRRFVTPMLMFVGCVLMTAGLVDYAAWARLNSHSSRTMIAAIVFAYTALPIGSFVAGRYSAIDRFVSNGHVHNGQKYVPANTNSN